MYLYHGTIQSFADCIVSGGFKLGEGVYWLGSGIYFFANGHKAHNWTKPKSTKYSEEGVVVRIEINDEATEKYLLDLNQRSNISDLLNRFDFYLERTSLKINAQSILFLRLLRDIKPFEENRLPTEDEYRTANRALGQIIDIILNTYEMDYKNTKIIKKSFVNPSPKQRTACFYSAEEIYCIRDVPFCNKCSKVIWDRTERTT